LATLSLMFAVPTIDRYLSWITEKGGLRSIVGTTIGTQIVVLPYILFTMGNFSVLALVSNILTLVLIPVTMLLGFLVTTVSFISEYIALPFAYITHLLLYWILFVGETIGNLSWSSLNVRAFPVWIVLVWYFAYLGIYIHGKHKTIPEPNLIYKNL